MPIKSQTAKVTAPVREAQARLAKIFGTIRSKRQLDQITGVIVAHLRAETDGEASRIVEEKGLKPADFKKIASGHRRAKKA